MAERESLPRTMARVLVALRSFLADILTPFFLLVLFVLRRLKREPDSRFCSFLPEPPPDPGAAPVDFFTLGTLDLSIRPFRD